MDLKLIFRTFRVVFTRQGGVKTHLKSRMHMIFNYMVARMIEESCMTDCEGCLFL